MAMRKHLENRQLNTIERSEEISFLSIVFFLLFFFRELFAFTDMGMLVYLSAIPFSFFSFFLSFFCKKKPRQTLSFVPIHACLIFFVINYNIIFCRQCECVRKCQFVLTMFFFLVSMLSCAMLTSAFIFFFFICFILSSSFFFLSLFVRCER